MPVWHLAILIEMQITHKTAGHINRHNCDQEVRAIARNLPHMLELIWVVLHEVDQVEECEQTTSSEVIARVCPTEAYLFPLICLLPAARE